MRIDPETRKRIEAMLAGGEATEGPPAALPMPSVELHKHSPKLTERAFQRQVIDLAHLRGWDVAHFRPARVLRGGKETYETPIDQEGKGFFDLFLVRDRLVVIELKVPPNKPTEHQLLWLARYKRAGVEAYIYYPSQWAEIEEVLR